MSVTECGDRLVLMSGSADGAPERLGRLLGRAVVRGRVAARRLSDPETVDRFEQAGRAAAQRAQRELANRGPDAAEQIAERAVDRVFWGLGTHSGLLVSVIRPLAQPMRNAAGTLARDLAKAAGGTDPAQPQLAPPDPTDDADPHP